MNKNPMQTLADDSLAQVSGGTVVPAPKPITEDIMKKAIDKAIGEFAKKHGIGRTRCFPPFTITTVAGRPTAHRV